MILFCSVNELKKQLECTVHEVQEMKEARERQMQVVRHDFHCRQSLLKIYRIRDRATLKLLEISLNAIHFSRAPENPLNFRNSAQTPLKFLEFYLDSTTLGAHLDMKNTLMEHCSQVPFLIKL